MRLGTKWGQVLTTSACGMESMKFPSQSYRAIQLFQSQHSGKETVGDGLRD